MDWLAFLGLGALRTDRWRRRLAWLLYGLAVLAGLGGVAAIGAGLVSCEPAPPVARELPGAPVAPILPAGENTEFLRDDRPIEVVWGPPATVDAGLRYSCAVGHRCKCGDRKRP